MRRMIYSLETTTGGKRTELHAFFVHVSGQKTSALMSLSVYISKHWTSFLFDIFCAKADFLHCNGGLSTYCEYYQLVFNGPLKTQ
jgi:hypothetical protein